MTVKIQPELGSGGMGLMEIKKYLVAITDSLNSLKTQIDDLQTKYNAHIHTENADAAYTQNANTSVPSVTSDVASEVSIEK